MTYFLLSVCGAWQCNQCISCNCYFLDRDRNGFIDVDEFLIGVRGEMNDRRRALVRLAFGVLDTDRSGDDNGLHTLFL